MRQNDLKIKAIDKALMILSSFTPHNEEMGTLEISQKLGFHKATVSRILQNLTKRGFLIQNSHSKKFVLGPAVMDLARAVNQSLRTNMVQTAKPFIDTLRDSLNESIVLEILSGETTFMAYIADGSRLVRLAGSMGDRVPIHASAGAKALLAFSPNEVKDRLLNVRMHPFTRNTITDRTQIEQQLEKIRKEGIAFDHEEIDEGTSAIGAPIFNHDSAAIGAVVVAGPTQRIMKGNKSRIISELKNTAAKISTHFHYVKTSDE